MKKLLSVLLVLLLLGSATAFAETCEYYAFSDPMVDIQNGDNSLHLDFAGLSLAFAPAEKDGEEIIAFNILGDGTPLLAAAFRISGDQLLVDLDGWSHTYCTAIPAMQAQDGSEDSPLAGVDVEKLTLMLLTQAKLEQDGDTMRFELPYTAVNALAEELLPAVLNNPGMPAAVDADQVMEAFAEFKESDSGVTLTGSYTQTEDGMSAELNVFVVMSGETGEEPVAVAKLVMADVFTLDIDVAVVSIHLGFDANTGLVEVLYKSDEQTFSFSGRVEAAEGEIRLAELGDAASAIPVDSLSEEETELLGNETIMAASDLLNFLAPVLENIL